jgi:C4-dicarboxylate-binding protein DctP
MIRGAISRRTLLGSTLAAPFIRSARAEPVQLRVSVDSAPKQIRTQSIADFLKKLEAASQGGITTQLFDGGQLFADHEAIRAVVLGQLEMAVPATWLVASYVPEADLGQLPVFYGQPAEVTHHAIDGVPGDLVNEQISRKLRVTIPGRWIDLGFTNWYGSRKPLRTLDDLKGLKIRTSGGVAQPWRTKFFGGVPDMTAWTDVPLAMSQGNFDALQSTDETCVNARLWDVGLRYGLIDHQSMDNYIPMISEAFWSGLTPALKTLVTDLWAANIGLYRTNLAAEQDKAEARLQGRGVKLAFVAPDQLAEQRRRMLADQDKVAHEMRMSPEFISRINEAVDATN